MIVKEFDLSWPAEVYSTLNVFSLITNSSEIVFSIDCFLLKSGLNINFFDEFPIIYLKTILYSLSPILVGSFGAFVWFCIYYGAKKFSQRET
jgi:hypothetical protein